MAVILLQAADRVWLSIPAWQERLRPYALGRQVPFRWLPVPSGIPVAGMPGRVREIRSRCASGAEVLIGHLGTYGAAVSALLEPLLLHLAREGGRALLLLGNGGEAFAEKILRRRPEAAGRLHATGLLSPQDLSCHIAACDLFLQPYPDGVSTRRTSLMAALSHGKPVVTTTGHLTEPFWAASGAVALAPVENMALYLDLIRQLCKDESRRRRMSELGRRLYQERFDISHTIAALRGERAAQPALSCAS
jgi:glycosyltransferase involved in cell wall biosynthesis